MEKIFQNKYALITGSTRGIGLEIARALVSRGASVCVNSRNKEDVDRVVKEFRAEGLSACGFAADISRWDAVQHLFAELSAAFGGALDMVVNNAGVSSPVSDIAGLGVEDWEKIIAVNLSGPFYVAKSALPLMKKNGGVVINVSSMAYLTQAGSPNAAYSASKGGLVSLTRALAKEGGGRIRVNAVSPGYVGTEKFLQMVGKNEEYLENLQKGNPLGRIATVADVANLVLFLVSEEAAYINGQVIHINGGAEVLKK